MAIRNLRKNIKPIIWILTIGFFISMLAVIVSNISMGLKNKQYAFKVNGERISILELERNIGNIEQQFGTYFSANRINREDAKLLAVDSILRKEAILTVGKDLKVKVSKSELKDVVASIEAQIPDKEQFSRMLKMQGYTKKTFEDSREDMLLVEKTRKKIIESIKLSDEEKIARYEEGKYQEYRGKSYEEVYLEIEDTLRESKGRLELIRLMEEEKRNMKVDDVREQYGNITSTIIISEGGFDITDVDILNMSFNQIYRGVTDIEEAKANTKEEIEKEIKLGKLAIEKGILRDTTLPVLEELVYLKIELKNKMKEEIIPSEGELMEYFELNKENYDINASVDANIISFKIEPTDFDMGLAREKAEKILEEVTPENFADMARLYSEGPSGVNGGELGWFGKGQMVPEFERAAFEIEEGKVSKEVVKTQFGYHIIFVEEKNEEKNLIKAAHILIEIKPSEDTFRRVLETAKSVKDEIVEGKLTFEEGAKNTYSNFKEVKKVDIREDGYIELVGYEDELTEKIFESDLNVVEAVLTKKGIYVYEKTNEVKNEEADFEKSKDRVLLDYKNRKLIDEMEKYYN